MLIDNIRALETARAKVAALEQQVESERNKALASLPSQYGFADASTFVAAVRGATGGVQPPRSRMPASVSVTRRKPGKRRRAKITDETRTSVKKLVADGKTGGEIAKSLGISMQSVQNIKKALGMVKPGKKAK